MSSRFWQYLQTSISKDRLSISNLFYYLWKKSIGIFCNFPEFIFAIIPLVWVVDSFSCLWRFGEVLFKSASIISFSVTAKFLPFYFIQSVFNCCCYRCTMFIFICSYICNNLCIWFKKVFRHHSENFFRVKHFVNELVSFSSPFLSIF